MLKISKPSPARVDIDLDGHLDADQMRAGLDELITLSDGVSHGVMMYRIRDFALPSMGALAVEFTRLPKLFGLLGKFDRCAVLTDVVWLQKAAEIEGRLIPGLEIKAFDPQDSAAAEAWLAADMAEA